MSEALAAEPSEAPKETAPTPDDTKKNRPPPKPIEYNPRYKGYTLILLTTIINLSSVSNISTGNDFRGNPGVAAAFAALTLCFTIFVLALDRMQLLIDSFNYSKSMDGYLEGYVLGFFTLLWICLVAFITQVDGVGYLTMNIYFSAWAILASIVYTLNEWSASKDILSIAELTSVSATLKGWYVLLLSSLVVLGTSINVIALKPSDADQGDAALGLAVGIASSLLSMAWICVHYNFIEFCSEGGWTELLFCAAAVLAWIVTTAVITKEGGVGSTVVGNECNIAVAEEQIQNCSVTYFDVAMNATRTMSCMDLVDSLTDNITITLGSNLYVFTWLALASSIHIAFRWKAQQALHFAQAQSMNAAKRVDEQPAEGKLSGKDDDLEDFEDADDF